MGSKRIVGDLVWPCGEQRYTARPLSSHVFSFSVSWFPDMLLKYAKKSHPFPSKIWKKVLTCWMLTFQKSYKFHHFHHLNLSCDWEFNCSSRNIWTISGGCRKWGFPQIIPKLDHFRKFSLETSIETDGFGDPFKEPPIFPISIPIQMATPSPRFATATSAMLERTIQLLPVSNMILSKYDDHCLVACNHEADSSSKIVM